jgi:hypothetical protein
MGPLSRIHPLIIGHAVAGVLFMIAAAWAKHAGAGMTALVVLVALVFGWCAAWRVITGRWPGDEFYS